MRAIRMIRQASQRRWAWRRGPAACRTTRNSGARAPNYPTRSTYLFHLAQAHAFVDGNKRTAVLAMDAFLELNGALIAATEDELFEFVMGIASGEISRDETERWVATKAKLSEL